MPERIMNAVGRPIPLHLYIKCKEDFDKAHEGAPKTQDIEKSLLVMDDDADTFGLIQRVDGMTM